VQENSKAFGCSGWREGCHFTLWKDGLKRGGGPELNEKLVKLVLEKNTVTGSTGTIALADGRLTFTPKGADAPSVSFPIVYQKN
jgi:DNA topoisomerase-3